MQCQEIAEWLSEHVDGRLDPERERLLAEHLAACDDCRQELAALETIVAGLRNLPAVEPPADLVRSVRAEIERPRLPLLVWNFLALPQTRVAVAAGLALVIGFLGLRQLEREKPVPAPAATRTAAQPLMDTALEKLEADGSAAEEAEPVESAPTPAAAKDQPLPAAPRKTLREPVDVSAGSEINGRIWRAEAEERSGKPAALQPGLSVGGAAPARPAPGRAPEPTAVPAEAGLMRGAADNGPVPAAVDRRRAGGGKDGVPDRDSSVREVIVVTADPAPVRRRIASWQERRDKQRAAAPVMKEDLQTVRRTDAAAEPAARPDVVELRLTPAEVTDLLAALEALQGVSLAAREGDASDEVGADTAAELSKRAKAAHASTSLITLRITIRNSR